MIEPRRGGRSLSRSPARDTVRSRAWIGGGFLILCFLLGGSSRFVLLSDVPVRLVSTAAIGAALWRMPIADRVRARPFAWAVIAIGTLMAAQLVPLPPGLWAALPGRGAYQDALTSVDLADRWRPMSISPDLTLESLLALLPLMAAALLFAPMNTRERRLMLDILIACLIGSAVLAVTQIVSQSFYLYDITNQGSGVGLFANRNHEALFISLGIVLVFGRTCLFDANNRAFSPMVLAMVGAAALFPILIVTGSRAGLIAGVLALLASMLIFMRGTFQRQRGRKRFFLSIGMVCLFVAAGALATMSSRQLAIQRLFATNGSDLRGTNLPVVLVALKTFFPFGSGFGTFDIAFRRFETYAMLDPAYFNHAHSDPIEIVIEGGVPAILLLFIGLFLLFRNCGTILSSLSRSSKVVLAQIGTLSLALLLMGSLIDYPLRTPFLGVLAILFATWIRGAGALEAQSPALGMDMRVG